MRVIIVICLCLLAQLPSAARGAPLVSNLDVGISGGMARFGGVTWLGGGFTTGPSATGYSVESITIRMGDASPTPSDFSLGLYSGSGGEPGTLIAALVGDPDPATAGDYVYTASGLTLPGDTEFFLVAQAIATGRAGYNWARSLDTSETSPVGWSIGDFFVVSQDEGSNWVQGTSAQGVLRFEIAGPQAQSTLIPEPSSIALWSLLGLGLFAFRRFRRRGMK